MTLLATGYHDLPQNWDGFSEFLIAGYIAIAMLTVAMMVFVALVILKLAERI